MLVDTSFINLFRAPRCWKVYPHLTRIILYVRILKLLFIIIKNDKSSERGGWGFQENVSF